MEYWYPWWIYHISRVDIFWVAVGVLKTGDYNHGDCHPAKASKPIDFSHC